MAKFINRFIEDEIEADIIRWHYAAEDLAAAVATNNVATVEELSRMFSQTTETYLNGLERYLDKFKRAVPNLEPNSAQHRIEHQRVLKSLTILFTYLSSLRTVATSVFNRIVTEKQDLSKTLRRVSGKIRALSIYNRTGSNANYIGESFTSMATMDVDNPNVDAALSLDIDSGVVTLPVKESMPVQISKVKIDQNISNGTPGNYSDDSISYSYDNLYNLADNQPHTWWEYELISTQFLQEEEIFLSLTLDVSKPELCNKITISPMNIGTVSEVEIVSIEGSIDGQTWIDLVDSMPLADYLNETRSTILDIGRSDSLSTNTVSIYFPPILVRYIRVLLKHNEPVQITSRNTLEDMYRYAIAIKDVSIYREEYLSAGALYTKAYDVYSTINNLGLLAAITDVNSDLYDIDFGVSINDSSFVGTQLLLSDSLDAPEILSIVDFEVPADEVSNLSFRVLFSRKDRIFSDDDFLHRFAVSPTSWLGERFTIDYARSPQKFTLSKKPIADSISLMETPIFQIGKSVILGRGRDSLRSGSTERFPLPLRVTKSDYNLNEVFVGDISVFVNGEEWSHVDSLSNVSIDSESFELHHDRRETTDFIKFGNSGGTDAYRSAPASSGGKALPSGAKVEFYINPELLNFRYTGGGYQSWFRFPFDGDLNNTTIEYQANSFSVENKVLAPGFNKITLEPYMNETAGVTFNQYDRDGTPSAVWSGFTSQEAFVNGSDELTAAGAGSYSIDYISGILYTYDPVPADRTTIINYSRFERQELEPNDFSLIRNDSTMEYVGIYIPQDKFRFIEHIDLLTSTRDSTSFLEDSLTTSDYFPSISNVYETSSVVVYLSRSNIIEGSLVFSSDFFDGETFSEVNYVDGASEFLPGSASSQFDMSSSNKYSVDYKRGRIHLSEAVTRSATSSINYKSSLYRVRYNVANYISDFTVIGSALEVDIEQFSKASDGGIRVFYQYKETQSPIRNLARFFTPVLRDVQIRLI